MTNPKLQINHKSQISNSKCFGFSVWNLFVICYLIFGALPFSAFSADTSIKDASDSFANLDQTGFLAILNYWTGIFMWLVGILTFLVMLYAAVLYMSAGANEENAKKAKKFLIWGMVGAVIEILSLSIVAITKNLIGG